jgi:o-succinylbenzoate synthase
MSLQGSFFQRTFTFRFDARTSRGPITEKHSWFVKVWEEGNTNTHGIGECGPLPGLSMDFTPELERVLDDVLQKLQSIDKLTLENVFEQTEKIVPKGFPSVTFAFETAFLDLLNGGRKIIYDNNFLTGQPILINGLVWMGDKDFMVKQVHTKIADGFRCIKIKIGGLDFDTECNILESIRNEFREYDIILRLDANGAFSPDEALTKLKTLSKYDIHSIEQPIKPGREEMVQLCRESPIPIALDEELIGKEHVKSELLKRIKPQYIILKPTLHGGLKHCTRWIEEAEQLKIEWWITSALESNIGLNAICQFAAHYYLQLPQGLGTGMLYENNISSPLKVANGFIAYDPSLPWEID